MLRLVLGNCREWAMKSMEWKQKHHKHLFRLAFAALIILLVLTHRDAIATQSNANPSSSQVVVVKKGDSIAAIFKRLKIKYQKLQQILTLPKVKKPLTHIRPGQKIHFQFNRQHRLTQLTLPINRDTTLVVQYRNKQWLAKLKKKPTTLVLTYGSATIRTTLAAAAKNAGLTKAMYHELTRMFRGSVDFRRALRRGDHFNILYQQYYVNGKKDHAGHIVAAKLTNRNKTYTAIRYRYPNHHTAYYTLSGHGIEPLFLKRPVNYKRISGYFTYRRMDPVLHRQHPHLGIDYAAAYGTPIRSIGNGKVISAGRHGGYGNAVVIKYGRHYKALYGHMKRFAKNIHHGVRVRKGQVIGYVGSTGWATGAHLHFELYVNGKPRNPLTMKLPDGRPIPKKYLKQYRNHAKILMAELKLHEQVELAENNPSSHQHTS